MGGIILLTVLLPIVALAGTVLGAMLVVPTLLFKPLFDITAFAHFIAATFAVVGTIFASLVVLPTLLVKPVFDITLFIQNV